MAIKLCLDVGNDNYIILWNFGGHVMSGFKVIEGKLSSKRLLSIKRPLLDLLDLLDLLVKLNKRPERLLDHLGACKKRQTTRRPDPL